VTQYSLIATAVLIASVGAAVYLYRLRLQTWREYPLQSALRSVIGGVVVLCLNFVIPTVSVQLPFSITVSEGFQTGPADVSFAPPADWVLLVGLALTVALASWLAYLIWGRPSSSSTQSGHWRAV
jgi:H+/Cl- antiporter ClcA